MSEVDEKDLKILMLLKNGGLRPNYTLIAKKVGLSIPSVKARIEKLQKLNYIKKFTTILNYDKVNKGVMAIVGVTVVPEKLNNVVEELKKISDVYEIYNVTGIYDLILKIRTRDISTLNNIIVNHFIKIDGVLKTHTMLVLSVGKEDT